MTSTSNQHPTGGDAGDLNYRIVAGEPQLADPAVAGVHAALDRIVESSRTEPDAGFESRVLAATMAAARRPARQTLWFRIAAVAVLSAGVGTAWLLMNAGTISGKGLTNTGPIATAPGLIGDEFSEREDEISATVADLVLAVSDDDLAPEIDSLMTEAHSLGTTMKADWLEGGAM